MTGVRDNRWATSTRVREGLGRRETYPDSPPEVTVRETHISWVFLAGRRAYKLKKPVVLDFLDYGTPERRREMCEEEVRLNRRLAPDVYVGVRGVALRDGRAELTAADDPRAIDFVVEMERYEERDTLASRLERGEVDRSQVRRVAQALARFHDEAPTVPATGAAVLTVERQFGQNLQELLALVEQRSEIGRVQALARFSHAFITGHARTLERRAATGCVRDGHGDLRAEHVLVDGDVRIVDCVEFAPRLRQLDVADDLAFLVLDLVAHGGDRLGDALVQAYRAAGGDPGDDELIGFYAAYRALVRAKVKLVRASQLTRGSSAYAHESASARELVALAERFAWRARLPLVLIVCGPPASGKSSLAGALADLARLPHLSSDVTRKELAGLAPTQRAPLERYDRDWSTRTYAELGRRTALALYTAGGAIVDATFRHSADRTVFTSQLDRGAPLMFLECRAPRAVLDQRARRRQLEPHRISDADAAVVLRELENWEALDEVPPEAHLVLRTDRSIDDVVGDLMAVLDRRLAASRYRSDR